MSFITLDFETYFKTRLPNKYSLKGLTYEEYIFNEEFDPYMVGIKIDNEKTEIVTGEDVAYALKDIFHEGNPHTMLAHNVPFDGAILHWYFKLKAKQYLCTQGMSNALWNQSSASLENLAKRLWPDDPTMRKGTELVSADGIKFADMTPENLKIIGGYCANDVDLCFEAFKKMYAFFPNKEFEVMHLCHRFFIEPTFLLDATRCNNYQIALFKKREALIEASGVREHILTSSPKFAAMMLQDHNITIPMIPSPTLKKPNNMKLALAKDDLEFTSLRHKHSDLEHIWAGRIGATSTNELARCDRLIKHQQADGVIAVPLKYSGAHTHRFSGYNSVNFQNFKRKSEIRRSLIAPPGKLVYVIDLSNIEARMLAWFAEEMELLMGFKTGADTYSAFASSIYGRTINRKLVKIDANGKEYKPDEMEGFLGKVCILGLGYQMGPAKFQTTLAKGALGGPPIFFDMERCTDIVYNKYRKRYTNIVALWKTAERVIREMANPNMEPFRWKCLTVQYRRVLLPSGLHLNYPGLKMVTDETGRESFEFWEGAFWKSLYGGLFIENIIQAISRIIMTDGMLNIDNYLITEHDGQVVHTAHDEVIAIASDNDPEEIIKIMIELLTTPPDWCNDGTLKLDAEADYDQCYSK